MLLKLTSHMHSLIYMSKYYVNYLHIIMQFRKIVALISKCSFIFSNICTNYAMNVDIVSLRKSKENPSDYSHTVIYAIETG